MRELVFEPLGMRHSSFDQTYPETVPESVAVGHVIGGEPVFGQWRILPEMAAAGLWTTAVDLAQVACELFRAHAGRSTRFLQKKVVDQALTPQLADDFGLGVQLEGKPQRFGHGGDNIGYKCITTTYLEQGMGVVALTNCDDGQWVIEEVVRAVAEEYAWPGYLLNQRLSPVESSESYAAYVGEYQISALSNLNLQVVATRGSEADASSQLVLRVPGQQPIVLRLTLGDTAAAFVADELNVEVRFTKNEAGEVTGLTLAQEQQDTIAKRVG
jgi:Beta-lactamase